ncbi:MAG TPA: energy transducer TonB [Candidatus Aquilonibacter sp.]|nr:energy transducer TonB [Candidatus Aquilonibacter sp.]
MLFASAAVLHAQTFPCGLTSMTETSQLIYPPIARAAHVDGTVVLLARFDTRGVPVHIKVVSGPPMLQAAALDFVKSWRANEYTGPRECPIAVAFNFAGAPSGECGTPEDKSGSPTPPPQRVDLQHYVIASRNLCFNTERDPAGHRIHNFLGHRWYSKS